MSQQEEYPKAVTEENLPQLVEKSKKIKQKYYVVLYGTAIIYSIVGFFVIPLLLSLSVQVVNASYSPTTMPSSLELSIIIILVFIVAYVTFLLYLFLFLENIIKKAVKLSYSELVFYECVLIVNSLNQGKKQDAIKEVNGFVSSLFSYQRDFFNSKARRYKPEIKTLKIGKTQIKRMILFSTENISEFFSNFGLALINNDHPTAYQHLHHIIDEAGKYGKLEGWFDKIRGQATTLQIILVSISIIVGIVVSLVTILNILGLT